MLLTEKEASKADCPMQSSVNPVRCAAGGLIYGTPCPCWRWTKMGETNGANPIERVGYCGLGGKVEE